jgi:polyhydroxyalkanoate synthesis repressor PhaR
MGFIRGQARRAKNGDSGRSGVLAGSAKTGDGPVVIKKYANRRLYNTSLSSYITLEDLAQLVRDGVDFVVYDAKSGDDITRTVLNQIIFEAENSGQNLLPVNFLRDLIRYYGANVQGLLPSYLEMSMKGFAESQEQWRKAMTGQMGVTGPIELFQTAMRRNMEMMAEATRAMTGLAGAPLKPEPPKPAAGDELAELRAQVAAMQARLDKIGQG